MGRRNGSREPSAKRRVLLITQWFDPEPTFKGVLFAKELQRRGYDVRVLTGFPNYPGGELYTGYRIKVRQCEIIQGIPVLRVPLFPSHDGSGTRRVLNYVSFAASATIAALFIQRPDVAYVYHPPATVGLPAMVLKWLKGVPYIYDVQDLWPDTLSATGMVSNASVLRIVGCGLKKIYRGASRVAVLSNGFRDALVDRGVPRRRIAVIPNWADEAQIDTERPGSSRAAELGFEGTFTVTFAGNLGKGQALDTVLDAAEILREEPNFRFLLVGGGVEAASMRERAVARSLGNVDFLPRRPINEIGEVLALSDALLVHLRDDPLFSITIPSKTQAYLMSGRPILMGVRGDAAQLIRDAGAGIAFDPENAAQLAHAVLAMKVMSPDERERLGSAGRCYYRENLSLKVGAKRFAELFDSAMLSKPYFLRAKRAVDIVASSLGLVVLGLPAACLAVAIRQRLGKPVLFRQSRPGRDDVSFEMIKFRTMTDARDASGRLLPDSARITKFGAMLRSTSLDELPSLWNVLRGHMSLVGPRPLLPRYTDFFTDEEQLRLLVRPGITGLAQVNGRNTASWDSRLAMDVSYVRHQSALLDTKIMLRTIANVFKRSGVVIDPESTMMNLDDERRSRQAGLPTS